MAPEVEIRRASEDDVDAVAAFGAVVVPAHYEAILGRAAAEKQVTLWWTRQRLESALANGTLLVAEHDNRIVGVAEVGTWRADQVIWKLYVRDDYRGCGIGQALLRTAIAELPRPASRVILEHFAGNERAAAFYERQGFVHLRTEPAASGDPAAALVWRVLDLESA